MTAEPAPNPRQSAEPSRAAQPPDEPAHPIFLVPGAPGDRTAEDHLPAGVAWVEAGQDPVADAIGFLRTLSADASALNALTGFAGLERLLVWAKAEAMAAFGPVGVRIGSTPDRQLSWLRRVQGPAQLADLLDLINPRVDRHRSMPEVFGDRARRARLLESLWSWGHSWQLVVDRGGVRLWAGAEVDPRVVSVAAWIGIGVDSPVGAPVPQLRLADVGVGGDGARLYRVRIHAPLHLAFVSPGVSGWGSETDVGRAVHGAGGNDQGIMLDGGYGPADCPGSAVHVDAVPKGVLVQVAGFTRRFTAPAILDVCTLEKVRVAPPDAWVSGWGDILVWFRADPARLP